MPLIEFKHVSRTYRLGETAIEALKGINLEIQQGEFTAITGPSGSGKSTLCHLIGAIDRPSSGQVHVNGENLDDLDDDALSVHRNRSLGFIFQQFNLVPVLSALENVLLPLEIAGRGHAANQEKARDLLASLGLESHMKHRPDKLSGGQRQRVAIARALITDAPLIVADEPTANLDTANARQILDYMRKYNREEKRTFVFSTHDPRLLDGVDRVIRLEDGRIQTAV